MPVTGLLRHCIDIGIIRMIKHFLVCNSIFMLLLFLQISEWHKLLSLISFGVLGFLSVSNIMRYDT